MRGIRGLTNNTKGVEEHTTIINTWRVWARIGFALVAKKVGHDLSAHLRMELITPSDGVAAKLGM